MADNVVDIIVYLTFVIGGLIMAYLFSVFINRIFAKLAKGIPIEERKRIEWGITIIIMFLAITLILSVFHIEVTILLVIIGLTGFIIIVGSRTYLENYVSGRLFLLSRTDPLAVGSYMEVEDFGGYIIKMGAVSIVLRSNDGLLLNLPYNFLLNRTIKVYPLNSEFLLKVPIQVFNPEKLERVENMIKNGFSNATIRLDATEKGLMIAYVIIPSRDPRRINDIKTDILKMINSMGNE